MKVIGWVGIVLLIVSVICSGIAMGIIIDPKRDNNTLHHVAFYAGLMLSIIGIVLILIGGRNPSAPKGYKQIVVSNVYAKNIMDDMKSYEKGGPVPCFARAPSSMYGRFKNASSSMYDRFKNSTSSMYDRFKNSFGTGGADAGAGVPDGAGSA